MVTKTKKNTQKTVTQNIAAVHGWEFVKSDSYYGVLVWQRVNNKGKMIYIRGTFTTHGNFGYGYYVNYGNWHYYNEWDKFITRMIKQ